MRDRPMRDRHVVLRWWFGGVARCGESCENIVLFHPLMEGLYARNPSA